MVSFDLLNDNFYLFQSLFGNVKTLLTFAPPLKRTYKPRADTNKHHFLNFKSFLNNLWKCEN